MKCALCHKPSFELQRGSDLIVVHNENNHAAQIEIEKLLEELAATGAGKLLLRELYDRQPMEFIVR